MAIGTNAAVWFYGTQDDLESTAAVVASGAFSVAGDTADWTNDDDATHVAITVEYRVALAADDNSGVNIYFQALNVDGSTGDDSIPEAEYRHTFMGFFPALNGITTIQRSTLAPIALPVYKTSSVWAVWLENQTGQQIDTTPGFTVFVTPMSFGPHA